MKNLLIITSLLLAGLIGQSQELELKEDGKYYQSGELFSGELKSVRDDGSIVSVRFFEYGNEDGISVYYFQNGQKKEERAYLNGLKHGQWTTWNQEGIKTAEAEYFNDEKHGKWFIYDADGTKRYAMRYDRGKKVGIWYMWDENGKLISEKEF